MEYMNDVHAFVARFPPLSKSAPAAAALRRRSRSCGSHDDIDGDEDAGGCVVAGRGTYGCAYVSGSTTTEAESWVVKVQRVEVEELREALMEFACYGSLRHPALMHVVAWAVEPAGMWPLTIQRLVLSDRCRPGRPAMIVAAAMPRGLPVLEALRTGRTTLRAVVAHTLSALAYLHAAGVAHGDVKPSNMVWHEGVTKLIDLGLAKSLVRATDGRAYMTGVGYSGSFRDPEYVRSQWNVAEADVYALARSWAALNRGGNDIEDGAQYTFSVRSVDGDAYDDVADLVARMRVLAADRPCAQALLDVASPTITAYLTPAFGAHSAQADADATLPLLPPQPLTQPHDMAAVVLSHTFDFLYDVCASDSMQARTLFLGFHLLHLVLPRLLPRYDSDDAQRSWVTRVGAATMHLAAAVCSDATYTGTVERWAFLVSGAGKGVPDVLELALLVWRVLSTLRCRVQPRTAWQYACDGRVLPALLDGLVTCEYTPHILPHMAASGDADPAKFPKHVLVGSLRWRGKQAAGDGNVDALAATMRRASVSSSFAAGDGDKTPFSCNAAKEMPAALDTAADLAVVRHAWRALLANRATEHDLRPSHLAVVLHNRAVLHALDMDEARRIVQLLKYNRDEWEDALDVLLHYDWRTVHTADVANLAQGRHPFTVTTSMLLSPT